MKITVELYLDKALTFEVAHALVESILADLDIDLWNYWVDDYKVLEATDATDATNAP